MKKDPSRDAKRARFMAGTKLVLERKQEPRDAAVRADLVAFFGKEQGLSRLLAQRYAASVLTMVEAFPEGDFPDDVIESHVEALATHDEDYAKKLFGSVDHHVLALKGTKTVVRRATLWLDEGDAFVLGGRRFKVARVTRERVDSIGAEEARREGFGSVEEFRRAWAESRPRAQTSLRPSDETCWRHEIAAQDEVR
jgi:hypothetical protein